MVVSQESRSHTMQLFPASPDDEPVQLPGVHGDARDVALAGIC